MPRWEVAHCQYCGHDIPFLPEWGQVPEYCRECRQPRTTACMGRRGPLQYKSYWERIPEFCLNCKEKLRTAANVTVEHLVAGTELARFVVGAKGMKKKRSGATAYHVTIYVHAGHVSGDIDVITGFLSNFHITIDAFRWSGNSVHRARGEGIIIDWDKPG